MPIERSFYFIRHGQTDWNKEDRLQGSLDIPLNEKGIEQAKTAAELTKDLPIDLIVTSDLSRAKDTSDIINEKLQIPIIIDPNIKERHAGKLEGILETELTKEQIETREHSPELVEEEGEPFPEFRAKIIKAINKNLENNPDKNILFSAHKWVYKAIYKELFQKIEGCDNACPYLFEKKEGKWNLIKL